MCLQLNFENVNILYKLKALYASCFYFFCHNILTPVAVRSRIEKQQPVHGKLGSDWRSGPAGECSLGGASKLVM